MNDLRIDKYKMFISFMLSQQQWSGLTKAKIDSWLNNFKDLSIEEQLLAYKLLTSIIYFSENDITDALKIGVFNCLSYHDVLEQQKKTHFSLSTQKLYNLHCNNIAKSCFVPLLDNEAPHESGNNICRILVQHNIVPKEQSVFIKQTPKLFKTNSFENLVIVDDCVGSGDQLKTFWNKTRIIDDGKEFTIIELCERYKVKANYLTLFGYNKSIDELRKTITGLNIVCVRELSNQHRVFSDDSYIWKDMDERNKAYKLFSTLSKNSGIDLLGYKKLDFAFMMHNTIPNWSLPMFWKENSDWNLLMMRKDSND